VPVFGLLKRGGRVYTLPIPNAKAKTLMPILESRVVPDSIVYTDSFASYDVIDVSTFHHQRIDHGKAFVAIKDRKRHTGGIENFWDQAKRHLRRYNGIPRKSFYYFLGGMRVAHGRGEPQGASSRAARMGQEGRAV